MWQSISGDPLDDFMDVDGEEQVQLRDEEEDNDALLTFANLGSRELLIILH
jgi:hypothetical protein